MRYLAILTMNVEHTLSVYNISFNSVLNQTKKLLLMLKKVRHMHHDNSQ